MEELKNPAEDIRFKQPTFIDPLTGLYNRYYLYEFLPQEIKKAQAGNYPLGIFILDIDHFKDLNDTMGHLTGDEILKQFSEALKKNRRQTDMVIRYAGDEFMLLLPGINRDTAMSLGTQLIQTIQKTEFKGKDDKELNLTVSLGFSVYPLDGDNLDSLVEIADKALYLSKEGGRNRVSSAAEVTLETAGFKIAMDAFPCRKFIGRFAEISKLKELLDESVIQKGLLRAAFIYGQAGSGKTRLVNEFCDYAQTKAIIIESRSSPKHKEDPYHLFSDAINSYLEKIGADSLTAKTFFNNLPPEELFALAKLIPQINRLYGASLVPSKAGRSLLFKSFLDLLFAIAKDSPLFIFFDDIQWTDGASLELLQYLIKYEKKRRFYFCVSCRDTFLAEEKEENKIKQLLDYLSGDESVTEIKLANLEQNDTCAMIDNMFPGLGLLKELNNKIFEITRGNPAFIEEIFKSFIENKLLTFKDKLWQFNVPLEKLDISQSLEETVKIRLKNLDRETKELIMQAAVAGEEFNVELLKKIGGKNEGYVFELLGRAKKTHLINSSRNWDKFNFTNRAEQDVLYNEMEYAQRQALHLKIIQALEEESGQNPWDIASELSFHSQRADPQGALGAKYAKLLAEKASSLFDPNEALDYLKNLTNQAKPAQIHEPAPKMEAGLSQNIQAKIIKLLRHIQATVKNFTLYPPGNSLRVDSNRELLEALTPILKETPSLHITEAEKSLILNNRRLTPLEAEEAKEKNIVSLLIEANIKTIYLIKGINELELSVFLDYLSQGRQAILAKGGWKKIIDENKLQFIKVEEFSYAAPGAENSPLGKAHRSFEDTMMMEFLLGKLTHKDIDRKTFSLRLLEAPEKFAEAIAKLSQIGGLKKNNAQQSKIVAESLKKITDELCEEERFPPEAAAELSRVIQKLDWRLRNSFIRRHPQVFAGRDRHDITNELINNFSDTQILDLLENNIQNNASNPLLLKDFIVKALPSARRKEEMLPKISAKLIELGINTENADFITGNTQWDNFSPEAKMSAFLNLPEEELENIDFSLLANFLEELLTKRKFTSIRELTEAFLLKGAKTENTLREKTNSLFAGFFCQKTNTHNRSIALLELLKNQRDSQLYADALNLLKNLVEEFIKNADIRQLYFQSLAPEVKVYGAVISKAFLVLSERLKSQIPEETPLRESIKTFFIQLMNFPDFFELVFFILCEFEPQNIRDVLSKLTEHMDELLIDISLKRGELIKDPFESYCLRKRFISAFKEFSIDGQERLKKELSQSRSKENSLFLIEAAGSMNNENFLSSLEPFLYNTDAQLRSSAVMALGEIGTKKSAVLLEEFSRREKDKQLQALAKNMAVKCLQKEKSI